MFGTLLQVSVIPSREYAPPTAFCDVDDPSLARFASGQPGHDSGTKGSVHLHLPGQQPTPGHFGPGSAAS
jgi:hypothetical protein